MDRPQCISTETYQTVSRCIASLCQLRQMRRSVSTCTFQSPDAGGHSGAWTAVLAGVLPAYLHSVVQSVLNATTWLTYQGFCDHVADDVDCAVCQLQSVSIVQDGGCAAFYTTSHRRSLVHLSASIMFPVGKHTAHRSAGRGCQMVPTVKLLNLFKVTGSLGCCAAQLEQSA